ncbi:MAG TPA: hypothetical protein VM686_20660 [Polyangiaceae bacterium]|nr:hypothetical protein [Polyangiaceae bacterium]
MNALKHFTRVAIVTTGLLYVAPVFAAALDTTPSCGDEGHDDDKKKDEKKGDDKS